MEPQSIPKVAHDTNNHHFENQSNFCQDLDHDHDHDHDHNIGTKNIETGTDEDNSQLKYENQDLDLINDLRVESRPVLDFDYYSLIEKISKEGVDTCLSLNSNLNTNSNANEIEWKVLKKALREEIVLKSNQMFEKYGGLDQFDYLPYNCRLHSDIENSQREEVSPLGVIGEYSCSDCGKSILENFLEDILEAFDCHTDFPPTIQRICELLLFPDCYNNTKSFLYALDKLVNVSCPITIEDPDQSETELSCSETISTITGNKRPLTESSNTLFNQNVETNNTSSKRLRTESDLDI